MEFKANSDLIYVQSKANKKGTGYYVELADDDFNKFRFFSKKSFPTLSKGVRVVPVLDIYTFNGRIQMNLVDLEVV